MEFKGSKGKWTFDKVRPLGENESEGFNYDIRVVKPEGEPHYPHTNIDVWGHFATKEETEANARLIINAPLMLAELDGLANNLNALLKSTNMGETEKEMLALLTINVESVLKRVLNHEVECEKL